MTAAAGRARDWQGLAAKADELEAGLRAAHSVATAAEAAAARSGALVEAVRREAARYAQLTGMDNVLARAVQSNGQPPAWCQ